MPKIVSVPDVGDIEFPDDASEDQILGVLKQDYPDSFKLSEEAKSAPSPGPQAPLTPSIAPGRPERPPLPLGPSQGPGEPQKVSMLTGMEGYLRDVLKNVGTGIQRGWASAESARGLEAGDLGLVARSQKAAGKAESSVDLERFSAAKTFKDSIRDFMRDPLGIGSELTAESMAALLPTLARRAPARVAVGATAGAAAGAPAAGIGAVPGALLGSTAGFAEALGRTSYDLEYTGKFLEELGKAGYDVTKKEDLAKALEDRDLVNRIHGLAHNKALVIGMTDAASALVGGKAISKPARSVLGKIGEGFIETGVQAALGAAGEAGGEAAAGEQLQPGQILAEAVAEPFGSAPEISVGAARETMLNRLPTPEQRQFRPTPKIEPTPQGGQITLETGEKITPQGFDMSARQQTLNDLRAALARQTAELQQQEAENAVHAGTDQGVLRRGGAPEEPGAQGGVQEDVGAQARGAQAQAQAEALKPEDVASQLGIEFQGSPAEGRWQFHIPGIDTGFMAKATDSIETIRQKLEAKREQFAAQEPGNVKQIPDKPEVQFEPPKHERIPIPADATAEQKSARFREQVAADQRFANAFDAWEKQLPEGERLVFEDKNLIRLVTKDPKGGWRVTNISARDHMPTGHTEHATRLDALREVRFATRIKAVPFEIQPLERPQPEEPKFFGKLEAGDTYGNRTVLGNFSKKKDAQALANQHVGATVQGYLGGKFKRGWIVHMEGEREQPPMLAGRTAPEGVDAQQWAKDKRQWAVDVRDITQNQKILDRGNWGKNRPLTENDREVLQNEIRAKEENLRTLQERYKAQQTPPPVEPIPNAEQREPWTPKLAREQKTFLLSRVDEAIKAAPDEQPTWLDQDLRRLAELASQARNDDKIALSKPIQDALRAFGIPTTQVAERYAGGKLRRVLEEIGPRRRAGLLEDAVKAADEKLKSITIEVPGDGAFTTVNDKEHLKELKARAGKFPTARTNITPGRSKTTPTNPTKLGSPKASDRKANAFKSVAIAASTDETRWTLQYLYSDGSHLRASDGRILISIDGDFGGNENEQAIFDTNGKRQKGEEFATVVPPKFGEIIPENREVIIKTVDTERLFKILKQAEQVLNKDKYTSILLWSNPDGSFGVTAENPEVGGYEFGKIEQSELVGRFSARQLQKAVNALRTMGNSSIAIERAKGADAESPIVFKGKDELAVIAAFNEPKVEAPKPEEGGEQGGVQRPKEGEGPEGGNVDADMIRGLEGRGTEAQGPEPTMNLAREISAMNGRQVEALAKSVTSMQRLAEQVGAGASEEEIAELEGFRDLANQEAEAAKRRAMEQRTPEAIEEMGRIASKVQFFSEALNAVSEQSRINAQRPNIFEMTDDELWDYLSKRFADSRTRVGPERFGRVGDYTFAHYDAFAKWMNDRYGERDLEGMILAFKEAPSHMKLRYIKENKRLSAHKLAWIAHMATGAPIPEEDPPRARTTPRPTASGRPAPTPAAPPPQSPRNAPPSEPAGPPPPPRRQGPSEYHPFSQTALVQLLRQFQNYPVIRKLVNAYGEHKAGRVSLHERVTWDEKLATRVMAHEIGHFIDRMIRNLPKTEDLVAKLDPLNMFRERLAQAFGRPEAANNREIIREAKALSADMRGPFSTNDTYRNKQAELFADFMSAILTRPEMVNERYPTLHDAFQYLMLSKPAFQTAFEYLTSLLRGDTIVNDVMDQQAAATDRTFDELLQKKERKRRSVRDILEEGLLSMWHLAYEKEGSPKALENSLMDQLELSSTWQEVQNSLLSDQWNKEVQPHLDAVDPDIKRSMAILSQYSQANRTINDRRAAGKWIEDHPIESREMLRALLNEIPGLASAWFARLEAAADSELYDLGAQIVLEIHLQGEDFARRAARIIDNMEIDVSGANALMAFNVRGKLLNPSGLTPDTAKAVIDRIKGQLGQEKFDELLQAASGVREILFQTQLAAYEEGLIPASTFKEIIEPNRNNYVPYAVLDYWEGRLRAGIMTQKGTAKDVADTSIAAQMKASALNSWRQRQRQVKLLMEMYANGGEQIVPGQRLRRASDIERIRKANRDDDVSRAVLYVDGRPHLVEFPGDPDKAFERAMSSKSFYQSMEWLTRLSGVTHGIMQLFTTFSLPFALFRNPFRGFFTGLEHVGAAAVLRQTFSKELGHSMRLAANYAKAAHGGTMNPEIRHLVENGVLMPPRLAAAMVRDFQNLRGLLQNSSVLAYQIQRLREQPKWWSRHAPVESARRGVAKFGRAVKEPFDAFFTAYEAFEKIQNYRAAKWKGYGEKTAQAIARRGGIPMPGVGGHFTLPTEVFLPWTRVHLQGLRASWHLLRDPKTRAGFATRFTLVEIAPRLVKWAIGAGVLVGAVKWKLSDDEDDDDPVMKEVMQRISPYKLALDNVIPLYLYDPRDGSHHYFSDFKRGSDIPRHYEVVSLRVPSSEEGRLWGTLFYNMLANSGAGEPMGRPGEDLLTSVGNWTANYMLPGLHPAIETSKGLYDMILRNRPAQDPYRGGPAVSEELFSAGGTEKAKVIAGYVLNQTGGPGELAGLALMNMGVLSDREMNAMKRRIDSDKTPIPERIPVGRSAFSYDNYADYRGEKMTQLEEQKIRTRAKQVMSEEVRGLYDYYWKNRTRQERLTDLEKGRYQAASQFVNQVWGRLDDPNSFYAKSAAAVDGSKQARETARRDMDMAAAPYLAMFSTPEAARFSVTLHVGTGTAKVSLPAGQATRYEDILQTNTSNVVSRIEANPDFLRLPETEQDRILRQAREAARRQSAREFLQSEGAQRPREGAAGALVR